MPQRTKAGTAVNHGGVFQILGNALEKTHQYQGAHRQVQHNVGQHQRGVRVEQVQGSHGLKNWHQQGYQRKHAGRHNGRKNDLAVLQVKARNGISRTRGHHQ